MEEKLNRINIHSMRFHVFVYCIILVLIPTFIISYVSYRVSYEVVKNQTDNSEKLLLNQICTNISSKLNTVELSVEAVASNSDILRTLRNYQYMNVDWQKLKTQSEAALKSYVMIGDIISDIYIKTEEGKEMYFGLTDSIDRERSRFIALIDKYGDGNPVWVYQRTDVGEGKERLNYIVPFNDYYLGPKKLGCIVIDVRTAMFRQIFNDINRTKRGDYFVVDENNVLIYGDDSSYQKISLDNYQFEEEKFNFITFGGEREVLSYQKVSGTGWKVISKIPVREYLSYFNIIQKVLFICLFVMFLLAICMSLQFSKKFMVPINNLVKEMKEIEKGNFEIQQNVYRKDEIGYLKQRFDEMIKKIKELMEHISTKEKEKRKAELNALQAQIQPHFLYNTLNSVYCLAQINKQYEIGEIIANLSEILRMSVGYHEEFVTLKREIDYIEKYMEISNIRWGGRFQLQCHCPIDFVNYMVPKLILQPLIENSINHGFIDSGQKGHVNVFVESKDNDLVIYVKDDGIGIENSRMSELNAMLRKEQSEENASIGIYNVNFRLKLHFGAKYGLQFMKNEPHGLCAVLLLPKKEG